MSIVPTPPTDLARALHGARCVGVEFMYKPRPVEPRARLTFDLTLQSRLDELARTPDSAVVLLCADDATITSLQSIIASSRIPVQTALVNPLPHPSPPDPDTPTACGWDDPERWHAVTTTDRWARLTCALEIGAQLAKSGGALIFAAHDALWGRGLLARLSAFSLRHTTQSIPAAVSPYTPYQHSALPGVETPRWAITAINAAFGRDPAIRQHMTRGSYQGFWGKTGLLPFALCQTVLDKADRRVWEDDLEIDRAIRAAGNASRALWVEDAQVYRQALPVFDESDVRAVIDRTLHYSLNVPARPLGANSLLMRHLPLLFELRRETNPSYRRALLLTERIAHDCLTAAEARIQRIGATWIDWGSYRHVVRVGDPFVTVWIKHTGA